MSLRIQKLKSIAGVCGLNSSTILAGALVGTVVVLVVCAGLAILLDSMPMNRAMVVRSTHTTAAQQSPAEMAPVDIAVVPEQAAQPSDEPGLVPDVDPVTPVMEVAAADVQSQRTPPKLELKDAWDERQRQQRQLWSATAESIEQKIREQFRYCDVDSFVSEVRSLTSMANAVTNTAQYRQGLMTKLDKDVFCLPSLELLLAQELNGFHQQLSKLDDECLVQLQIDSGQDFGQLNYAPYEILPDEFIPASLVDSLHSSTYATIAEVIATQGASYVVGSAVQQSVRDELAYDSRGNYSFAGELESILWGFAAGVATEVVAQAAFDTSGALKNKLTSATQTVLESFLRADTAWRDSLSSIVDIHNFALLTAVAEKTGASVEDLIATIRQD